MSSDKTDSLEHPQTEQEETANVRVAVRCRPLSAQERATGKRDSVEAVHVDSLQRTVSVRFPQQNVASEPPKMFAFDAVFGPEADQATVYNSVARPIVENVLAGYNGTIFAYGQTGTGKTWTMVGELEVDARRGIIPNAFAHVFDHIAHCHQTKTFLVRVSYMELYNEEVRDLLAKPSPAGKAPRILEVKERPDVGVYVKDLTTVAVSSADQCFRLMHFGNQNRHTGATAMNEQSSRSHAIFTLTIECSETLPAPTLPPESEGKTTEQKKTLLTQGKLHLVDLAGSERQAKTLTTGERLREAARINLSLSTLGNVISALIDPKATHVPYRNSKLTRLLHDSLGGNSKTLMIANIGPAAYNADETLSTLRYASRAKHIKNVVHKNEDPKDALLRKFQEEIDALRKQLEEVELGGSDTLGPDDDEEGEEEFRSDDDDDGGDAGRDNRSPEFPDTEGNEKMPVQLQKSHKKQKLGRTNSQGERLRALEAEVERTRAELRSAHGLREEERQALAARLAQREAELERSRADRQRLAAKLAAIERKLITGGEEQVLERVEAQARLLADSQRELERARQTELALQERLDAQQRERQQIEQRFTGLHSESAELGRQLKRVWAQNQCVRAEIRDTETEHRREVEALLENIRQLQKESLFYSLAISEFIPPAQLSFIEDQCFWNEDTGEWHLKCIAYTGNNMRRDESIQKESTEVAAMLSSSSSKSRGQQITTTSTNPMPIHFSYADFGIGANLEQQPLSQTSSEGSGNGGIAPPPTRSFRPKSASRDRSEARIRALMH